MASDRSLQKMKNHTDQRGRRSHLALRPKFVVCLSAVLVVILLSRFVSIENKSRKEDKQQESTTGQLQQQLKPQDIDTGDLTESDAHEQPEPMNTGLEILQGTVPSISESGESSTEIPYYHCGPFFMQNTTKPVKMKEVLLLHGMKFTKEDWKSSGLMEKMCRDGGDMLSVTAIDFNVRGDGIQLSNAFRGLTDGGVISGHPLYVVSPSASGKSILSLASLTITTDEDDPKHDLVHRIIRGWIPVACGSVYSEAEQVLQVFSSVPLLAVYGSRDTMGKDVSNRLRDVAGAEVVELEGGHPCYLDSPDVFVETLLPFMDENS